MDIFFNKKSIVQQDIQRYNGAASIQRELRHELTYRTTGTLGAILRSSVHLEELRLAFNMRDDRNDNEVSFEGSV